MEPSVDTVDGITTELKRGTIISDRFEITGRVAAGGMGVVYRGFDKNLPGQEIALKVLHPQYCENPQVFKRFLNEVKVARALSHPNIVRLYDIGSTNDGIHYISMEFVEGNSLSRYLSTLYDDHKKVRHSKDQLSKLLSIYSKILEGISYAHSKGVVHRDLKPANILLSKEGEVKIADFGTARILGANSTITVEGQSNLGTPQYMSPEQVRGDELDAACDIYALGIIGYELVVGHAPFHDMPPLSVIYNQLNEPIPGFASSELGIPSWFQEFVFTATKKRKEDRFPSVKEMLRQLHLNASRETLELKDALSSSLTLTDLPIVIHDRRKNVKYLFFILLLLGAYFGFQNDVDKTDEIISYVPLPPYWRQF